MPITIIEDPEYEPPAPTLPLTLAGLVRIPRNLQATISVTFVNADDEPADPSPATAAVTVTRADGTPVLTAQDASPEGNGLFTAQLDATQAAALDSLTAAWTSSAGTIVTAVEVVGGFLFTLAQARKRPPLATTTAADLREARIYAEQELERACGVAFVPRYALATLTGHGRQTLPLKHLRVRAIRSLSIDGVALSLEQIAGVTIDGAGRLRRPSECWERGARIVVGYEHGYGLPPAGVSAAALDLAQNKIVTDAGSGSIDPRAVSVITQDGEIRLATRGRFGIPSVDAVVDAYRERVVALS